MQKKLLIWITECWDYEIKFEKILSNQRMRDQNACFMTNL